MCKVDEGRCNAEGCTRMAEWQDTDDLLWCDEHRHSMTSRIKPSEGPRAKFFVMGATEDGDAYVVNVWSEDRAGKTGYYGTEVIFHRDGRVEGDCFDSDDEWKGHRDEIIATARSGQAGEELGKFMRGEPCGDLV